MKTKNIAIGGIIAAAYVALTYVSALFGLSSGAIQVRISEALCVLPAFIPAAIPGLTIGCILANTLTGCLWLDVLFGSFATLIGAVGTRLLKDRPVLRLLPPIISNALIVPQVLIHVYGVEDALWFLILTVGAGELISVGVFGYILGKQMPRVMKTFDLHD